jgi:hypothetical protein
MALNTFCCETVAVPQFDKKCNITPRKGGIPFVGGISCAIDFTDITAIEEWQAAIASGAVVLFPEGIGSKPETEKTKVRLSSCKPENTVKQLHVLNFRTLDADLQNNTDFAKWEDVGNDWINYRYFYIDCNGNIFLDVTNNHGFFAKDFDLDHIIEETNEENQFFQITLRFEKMGIIVPIKDDAILQAIMNSQGS